MVYGFIVLERVQYLTLEALLITDYVSDSNMASGFGKVPTIPG